MLCCVSLAERRRHDAVLRTRIDGVEQGFLGVGEAHLHGLTVTLEPHRLEHLVAIELEHRDTDPVPLGFVVGGAANAGVVGVDLPAELGEKRLDVAHPRVLVVRRRLLRRFGGFLRLRGRSGLRGVGVVLGATGGQGDQKGSRSDDCTNTLDVKHVSPKSRGIAVNRMVTDTCILA